MGFVTCHTLLSVQWPPHSLPASPHCGQQLSQWVRTVSFGCLGTAGPMGCRDRIPTWVGLTT